MHGSSRGGVMGLCLSLLLHAQGMPCQSHVELAEVRRSLCSSAFPLQHGVAPSGLQSPRGGQQGPESDLATGSLLCAYPHPVHIFEEQRSLLPFWEYAQ